MVLDWRQVQASVSTRTHLALTCCFAMSESTCIGPAHACWLTAVLEVVPRKIICAVCLSYFPALVTVDIGFEYYSSMQVTGLLAAFWVCRDSCLLLVVAAQADAATCHPVTVQARLARFKS
jgi:hypothetical protein